MLVKILTKNSEFLDMYRDRDGCGDTLRRKILRLYNVLYGRQQGQQGQHFFDSRDVVQSCLGCLLSLLGEPQSFAALQCFIRKTTVTTGTTFLLIVEMLRATSIRIPQCCPKLFGLSFIETQSFTSLLGEPQSFAAVQ